MRRHNHRGGCKCHFTGGCFTGRCRLGFAALGCGVGFAGTAFAAIATITIAAATLTGGTWCAVCAFRHGAFAGCVGAVTSFLRSGCGITLGDRGLTLGAFGWTAAVLATATTATAALVVAAFVRFARNGCRRAVQEFRGSCTVHGCGVTAVVAASIASATVTTWLTATFAATFRTWFAT